MALFNNRVFVTAKFLLNFDAQQEMGETWCQGGLKKVKWWKNGDNDRK